MIPLGLRIRDLGNGRFSWSDLRALVQNRRHDSALSRAMDPDWMWRALEPNLLAFIGDRLAWLQWAKTEDAKRKRNRPQPIPRPGVGGVREVSPQLPLAEVKRRLALPRRPIATNGVES